ncbi:MAG: TlpA family protein disulfide reductase [Bacteroidales bacterium]|nr:TlpA family protein disulfide reductase [Bacteroidales bacterium]
MNLKDIIKKRWETYWQKKSWLSKASDLLFVLLLIGLVIPASRREISAFMAGLTAVSPKTLSAEKQSTVSDEAWNWQLRDANGREIRLGVLKGQTILLNFWATWCPPCIAEMPDLQELYINKSDRITFVLVSNEKAETINSFMEKKGFTMPVYQELSETPPDFATGSIPTTWVISPEGKIIIRKTGAAKWNSSSMHKLIDQQHPKR